MNKGIIASIVSYALWGFFPIYFHALGGVPAYQVTAHRFVWCFISISIVILLRKEARSFLASLNWRVFGIYLLAGVLLGVVILREKLRPWQWVVVGLAILGVLYLTIIYGQPPWIALVLAFSFGFYGFIKKLAPLGSLHGLAMETLMIFIPALILLLVTEYNGVGEFGHTTPIITLLLALTGIVTAIPLLLFSVGAKMVPLSTIGILQYIAPTIQFFLGIFFFKEAFSDSHFLGFSLIWLALIIFSVESFLYNRKANHRKIAASTAGIQ
jgi:chloramphenicol-sensitive protein RarD